MSKKILIVDDDPSTRKLVRSLLESNGYQVFTADDGSGALPAIKIHHPDAIIMDLLMPDLGGSEAVQQIQGDEAARKIPILFLTSVSTSDGFEDAGFNVQVGDLEYRTIIKPFQSKDLLIQLENIISESK